MVAPSRTPQARGLKCELCKKTLASATWLDQTKLAKNIEDARNVIELLNKHRETGCPCIPSSIENLLVGSTHFEIHRLTIKELDNDVHEKQYESFLVDRQKMIHEQSTNQVGAINDCHDPKKNSRFRVDRDYCSNKQDQREDLHLNHLFKAIDFWKLALEDPSNPFNSKLALRLGLTHHVIYACYLFKYYKIMDYQLTTANLLLNLFKTIEGVTENAIMHAYFLLIRSLLDCKHFQTARLYLKQAVKLPNYKNKSYYESILLTCVSCELSLRGDNTTLDELAELAAIRPDDKLQHYYARTLAITIVIRYIHCHPTRSENCYEFYHAFRYICAIMRRCYESSFDLVLSDSDPKQTVRQVKAQDCRIQDHCWIKFAICDFVFSTFDLLINFYSRSGLPEAVELLYNGLNLVAYRSGSCYWQTRMAAIGAELDMLCDKYEHAKAKLDAISCIVNHTSNSHLINLMRNNLEIDSLSLLSQQGTVVKAEVILDILERLKTCETSTLNKLGETHLYDCKTATLTKISSLEPKGSSKIFGGLLGYLSLKTLKIGVTNFMRFGSITDAENLMARLSAQLETMDIEALEYDDHQTILEILLQLSGVNKTEQLLSHTIYSSSLFLKLPDKLSPLESQLSSLTITDDHSSTPGDVKTKPTRARTKRSQLSLGRRSKRKGQYDVASVSEENLNDSNATRFFSTIEAAKNFKSMSKEELVTTYLRNSAPNPDYLLYRRAHELMFCLRLRDQTTNHDQLLNHFLESSSSNTMRYRWMMFDEKLASPYDSLIVTKSSCSNKHLGFCGTTTNSEHFVRTSLKAIPDNCNILQVKHIHDKESDIEHLLIVRLDSNDRPIYVAMKKSVCPDFFQDELKHCGDQIPTNFPDSFDAKIEEARKTLSLKNYRSRTEKRQRIESDLGIMIHDFEEELFGPFRFMLCGKICDGKFAKFVTEASQEIEAIMEGNKCFSLETLKLVVENGHLLSRDEFCQMVSILFDCSAADDRTRDCFNRWLRLGEAHAYEQSPNLNKMCYLQTLKRGQLGLILDQRLEHIPFESLPIVRINQQGLFRIPSMRLYWLILNRTQTKLDPNATAFMLDPANNLRPTKERFQDKLRTKNAWVGTIGQPPEVNLLESWLSTKQVYIFIGHGTGTAYYNRLCNGRGLSAMPKVKPASIVMGCSSGRVVAEGPKLESFGTGWIFVMRGAPVYVGLLWDVTDTDIDRFLDSLLSRWMGSAWTEIENSDSPMAITDAMAKARLVCQSKFLVGSTPVVYGLPVCCKATS